MNNKFDMAIQYLESKGIKAFEIMNILTIPVSSPEEIEPIVSRVKSYLKECGYDKSWRIDPYYYDHHNELHEDMFGTKEETK